VLNDGVTIRPKVTIGFPGGSGLGHYLTDLFPGSKHLPLTSRKRRALSDLVRCQARSICSSEHGHVNRKAVHHWACRCNLHEDEPSPVICRICGGGHLLKALVNVTSYLADRLFNRLIHNFGETSTVEKGKVFRLRLMLLCFSIE